MLIFTRAGEHGVLWYAVCLAFAAFDRPRRARHMRALRTVGLAYMTNIALKYVVRRRRPALDGMPPLSSTVTSLSYPSAHATTSFAAAHQLVANGVPVRAVYALAGAMALSRVYVGVHYPTDVLAGAALGTALSELLGRTADR